MPFVGIGRARGRMVIKQVVCFAAAGVFGVGACAGAQPVGTPAGTAPAAAMPSGPIADPIPEDPVFSGLGLVLEEFASFPRSQPTPVMDNSLPTRHARINALGEVPDGTGRLFVPDLNGKLYMLVDGAPREYLDVAGAFADFFPGSGFGQGFGYVAFHPEFAGNGRFYTVHTERGDGIAGKPTDLPAQPETEVHGVVTEWTAADPKAGTFQGTRREVLRLGFAGQSHNIQQIDFDPTAAKDSPDHGLLYVAAGDGGKGVDGGVPQDLGMPHGKLLRIDPAGKNGANGRYGIPAANPFVGRQGALGEIWAYGMRDPHRFSWDREHGNRLLLAMIGEHAVEAVYDVRGGDNLGWSEREGRFRFDRSDRCNLYPVPAGDAGFTYPVAAYDHDPPPGHDCTADSGHAIGGGFVYRGSAVPQLRGKYVFDDIVDGRLFFTEAGEMRRGEKRAVVHELFVYDGAGRPTSMQKLAGDTRTDVRIGADSQGELYVLSKANGKVWWVTGTRQFASCDVGETRVEGAMAAADWAPVTPSRWRFPGSEVVLAEAGTQRPGPRRPFEYATLAAGPAFESVQIEAEVRIDWPVAENERDVILVFGHRSDTEFAYTHLSSDTETYAHNGIFVVDNADRQRIETQWKPNRQHGAPPAITDDRWHKVRLVHCAATGEVAVYVDGEATPRMTAVSPSIGAGRVGFGSFDNTGRLRALLVRGTGRQG